MSTSCHQCSVQHSTSLHVVSPVMEAKNGVGRHQHGGQAGDGEPGLRMGDSDAGGRLGDGGHAALQARFLQSFQLASLLDI